MLTAADATAAARAPVPAVRSHVIGESEAVRAAVTRVSPHVIYRVRFQVRGVAGRGCVASVRLRVRSGATATLRFALVPRGIWCPGVGVLSVVATRPGAAAGVVRLRVRLSAAFGQGNLLGRLVLGPTCAVEPAGDPCDPVAHPDPVTLVALAASGVESARTVTLADGSFAFDLPAGNYTLRAEPTGAAHPSIGDTAVLVSARATRARPERVAVSGDTGIR
jgi:hypothetical protein